MRRNPIRRTVAAAILAAAIGAPAAGAKFDLNPPIPPGRPASPGVAQTAGRTQSASPSFDWGDAGIGAGVALVAVGLGAGAVRTRRRSPVAGGTDELIRSRAGLRN